MRDLVQRALLRVVKDPDARQAELWRQRSEAALRGEIARLAAPHHAARLRQGSGDLVLGLALGYGAAELAPFVLSLRRSGYDGAITLLTSGCDADTARFLAQNRVSSIAFHAARLMPMSLNSARMFRYLDLLVELADTAPDQALPGRILLADTRDIVFQSNPFGALGSSRLRFHLEQPLRLADCPTNSDWLRRALGPDGLQELGHHQVSCAGTLLGRADAVLEYLLHMTQLLLDVPPPHRFSGVDQAVHNAILWRGLVAGAEAVPNAAEVLTVPQGGLGALARLDGARILNADGSASAIVHQYDRDAEAKRALHAAYAA
jgi:hypothetical protein